MEKVPVTSQGYVRMEEELKILKSVERPSVIKAIAEARAHGDLSENAEYSAAREKQSFIEGRILELEDKIARAEVINVQSLIGSETIKFGATVTLVDDDTEEEVIYQIVGDYEAELKEGKVSVLAPVSRALIGKGEGDSVEVVTPKGKKNYEVISVKYA